MANTDVVAPFWGRKTYCLITGASQGIGRQFAIEIARQVGDGSLLLLFARSPDGLASTRALALKANPKVKIETFEIDLSEADSDMFNYSIVGSMEDSNERAEEFELAMIVHNAGTTGDVSERANEMMDEKKWSDYMSLNLVSMISLNATFLQVFPVDGLPEKCVVNVTSLCGIKPFKSMGYYCVGKASREMYMRVLAEEFPALNVINYSPGPVDTDMQAKVAENIADPEVKEMFVLTRTSGRILSTEQTTKRCLQILAERKYKSGEHVDYFDQNY